MDISTVPTVDHDFDCGLLAIEYLLGIDGTPPGQLMRVKEGKSWFYIETDEQALASYKKCRTFVEEVIKRGAHLLHPWLKAPTVHGICAIKKPRHIIPAET